MKTIRSWRNIFWICGVFVVVGCDGNGVLDPTEVVDDAPVGDPVALLTVDASEQFLLNGGLEEGDTDPTAWWWGGINHGAYQFEWSDSEAATGARSVSVSRAAGAPGEFAYWAQTIPVTNLVGVSLRLTASIRMEGVTGAGVAIVIRGDNTPTPKGLAETFATTQFRRSLSGSNDWFPASISLSDFDETIQSVTVYLVHLEETEGTVWFDDVVLSSGTPSEYFSIQSGSVEDVAFGDVWWQGGLNSSVYAFDWSNQHARTGVRSLIIDKSFVVEEAFGFWAQTIRADSMVGGSVTLRMWLRVDDIAGQGIAIAVRGDDTLMPSGIAEAFASTQHQVPIVGTAEWTEYVVTLSDVAPTIKSFTVYLIHLPETTGTVYFDDVSLEVGG